MQEAIELLKDSVERMELKMHSRRSRLNFHGRDALGNPAAAEDAYGG